LESNRPSVREKTFRRLKNDSISGELQQNREINFYAIEYLIAKKIDFFNNTRIIYKITEKWLTSYVQLV